MHVQAMAGSTACVPASSKENDMQICFTHMDPIGQACSGRSAGDGTCCTAPEPIQTLEEADCNVGMTQRQAITSRIQVAIV